MVFAKVNSTVLQLVHQAQGDLSAVGCHPLCSKQLISFEALNLILKQLHQRAEKVKQQIEKAEEEEKEKIKSEHKDLLE
jgi:hypothetical protein